MAEPRGLIAPQEFKGTLTAVEAADAIARGLSTEHPGWRFDRLPMADGGPGTTEALLAALFRDGGLEASRVFIEKFVLPSDLAAQSADLFSTDFKSALQERLQASRLGPGEYRVVEEKGPEHRKTFTVEVTAGDELHARGSGKSKKAAEQQAAERLLAKLAGKRPTHG